MSIKHEQRVAGIVPLTVFADILKDELVPHAKIEREGATRIVSMSPIDLHDTAATIHDGLRCVVHV